MPKQSILTMETKITSILEGQHYNPTVYFILKVLHSARYLKLLQYYLLLKHDFSPIQRILPQPVSSTALLIQMVCIFLLALR